MSFRTPAQIETFLDQNGHKFDLPVQYMGDEPNSYQRDWDSAAVRMCMFASWPYEQAAGNQSIPMVYKTVNTFREDFLCDRWYLPATPRDMRMLKSAGLPCFGVETKHQLSDFDVIGTSISYPVLTINTIKQLLMSDIPPRWKTRQETPEKYPMVIVGGQAYGAPEGISAAVDCWFAGEVEDEPGNPGLGAVLARVAEWKQDGRWHTEREECYKDLAREFNFLYFPRFIDVHYEYQERQAVQDVAFLEGLASPSKQVTGYSANIEGMRLPIVKRHVKNLDAIEPLTNPPLLYVDPGMGSGDMETGRGCPAWCSFCALCLGGETRFITRDGVRELRSCAGETVEVWTHAGWKKAEVDQYGVAKLNTISLRQMDLGIATAETCVYGHSLKGENNTSAVARVNKTQTGRPRKASDGGQDSGFNCRECKRIRARNSYYEKTGRPELVEPLTRVREGHRRDGTGSTWRRTPTSQIRRTVRATENHRWPLADGTVTAALKQGDRIRGEAARVDEEDQKFKEGWIHGFTFGDGSKAKNGITGYRSDLHMEKDNLHRWRFEEAQNWTGPIQVRTVKDHTTHSCQGEQCTYVWINSTTHLKSWPTDQTAEYTSGFLAGWMAADAWPMNSDREDLNDIWVLDAEHRPGHHGEISPTEWLEENAATAGWILTGAHTDGQMETNLGTREAPLVRHNLRRPDKVIWYVESIEEGTEEEPIFCAEVPGEGLFTLATGVYTGNTYRQKPYRQRTVDYMVKFGKELMRNTGGLHVAPFSPDFPMHTQKKRLISALLKDVTDEVDASSMRVDDFIADTEYILLSAHGGMDQVTLGVEGNSQRMRDLVGKGCSDTDIKEAVARGIRAGIRRFKLYMISDLPGEDRGDIFRILQLAKELADIRDGMGQHTVKIQFSWTPLLIEANTPFQWFAPTQSNRALGDVWEEFRDIKIDFKLGGKAERNKIAYFQLNQRASRDVGEAIIDVVEAMSTDGCWGGVPKSGVKLDGQEMATYEALDYALKKHGFLNGLADCFDERQKHEMFGWEFISQGISTELLWVTYQQMREFLETTDSDSYDGHFDDNYHGSEWIERCDVKCYGKTCGTCDTDDLKIRRDYIAGAQLENTVDLMNVAIIDQRSLTMKARLKVDKDDEYRFVGNDHWRYALRRAANRAELPLTKRRVRFVSDAVKYKEHSSGIDFVEIGLTKNLNKKALREFAERMNEELTGIKILEIFPHPAASDELRDDVDLSLYQMEVDLDQTSALTKLEEWEAADYVPMILKEESRRMGQVREEVNAKEFAPDLWFIRDGHRLLLRMTVRGKASPYDVYQAFSKKNSQIEAKKYPAHRLGAYVEQDASQYDFFRPDCARCDRPIPVDPLDAPFDANFCPKCLDLEEGRIVGSMVQQ